MRNACAFLTPPSHVPFNNQHITDCTFLFPSLQPTNQFKPNAAAHQPNPESSTLLSSPLQHQANCLQSIHKTIQQFNQYLKAEHLDKQALQLIALQLQNDFALLRYLLFSDQGTAAQDPATSPIINPNPKPNPTSSAFTLPCTDDAKLCRSTPVGAVGIHSQYFFLYDKIRQLEPGNSDAIIWKIPSVKFVFDSAKKARPSSDPLIEPATSFSSPIFRTHPHGYNFFIKFYPYGIGPATGKCASIQFTLFPGDYDNLLKWPFSKLIHIGIRDQLDPMNTWMKTIRPDQDPAYKRPTMSAKTGAAIILINNFIPHSKHFNATEGFLIDDASFIEIKFSDPPVMKPQTQTSLLFPFP